VAILPDAFLFPTPISNPGRLETHLSLGEPRIVV
jgi:hypothetical protein